DSRYGKGTHNRFFREHFACHRLLLACVELAFRHPATQTPMCVRTTPGTAFLGLIHRLGWSAVSKDALGDAKDAHGPRTLYSG
ncbi:MAG: pseudouridylate synthase, partial [Pseudomonadota bacterium]